MRSIAWSFPNGRRAVRLELAVLLLLTLLRPTPARAVLTGSWTGDFSIPAFDGSVTTCAIIDRAYYVGGDFRWAGEQPVRNVAMWTGSSWTQVGLGLPSPVRQLLALPNGELPAGTDSYLSGNSPVLRFDGTSWAPIGAGLYGEVEALLVDGPNIYAAGMLYQVGDLNGYRVMRWDGAEWQPIGGLFDNRILCLAMFQGQLYAGGDFLNSRDMFVSRIARWDGAHWLDVGGGTGPGGNSGVAALTEYGGRLIAGGVFSSIGGVETGGIAAWNGNVWEALPNRPQDTLVRDLQVEGSVLHVAGVLQVPGEWAAGLATFNGQTWLPPTLYPDWSIDDIAIADGALIAVGQHSELVQRDPRNFFPNRDVVVRDPGWHGLTPWRATMRGLLGPAHTEVAALTNYGGELYAGGYFQYAADPPFWTERFGVAHWDGVAWQALSWTRGWVQEMTLWRDRLVVGGPGFSGDAKYSSVMSWDGREWSDLGQPIKGWVGGLAEWQGALVAVGQLELPGSNYVAVAVNRGSGWEKLGDPIVRDQGALTDVASFGGSLYVAGQVVFPGTGYRGVARWDGSSWVQIPDTPLNYAQCLLVRQDGLWVAGTPVTGVAGGSVWKWDGTSWTSIEGLVGSVYDLIEMDGVVFAAGALYPSDGPTGLAQWDGTAWHAVPGAPPNRVTTLAVVGRDLWLGGSFTSAGGRQAEGLARWRRDTPAPQLPLAMAQPWPTPARDRVSFRFTLPADGRVELRIYDVRGALVAKPLDEWLPGGTHERTWSIAASGEQIRPGVYFARLVTPTESRHARIVIGASAPIHSARSQP